jgi:hypothetical protein
LAILKGLTIVTQSIKGQIEIRLVMYMCYLTIYIMNLVDIDQALFGSFARESAAGALFGSRLWLSKGLGGSVNGHWRVDLDYVAYCETVRSEKVS